MKSYFLNDGNPLPSDHHKAGMIGMVIDMEDGSPQPQRVYAKDRDELLNKLATMYGNTQLRITEVKREHQTRENGNGEPPKPARLTPELRQQYTEDLKDPAKAATAIAVLHQDATGFNAAEERQRAAEQEQFRAMEQATGDFLANNPDFPVGPAGALVRDRAWARTGTITLASLQDAYDTLKEEGLIVLPSTPREQRQIEEPSPSAQTEPRRATSTGVRPSTLGTGRMPEQRPKLSYEELVKLAATPEYEQRLRNEPGFAELVNQTVADWRKRNQLQVAG